MYYSLALAALPGPEHPETWSLLALEMSKTRLIALLTQGGQPEASLVQVLAWKTA